MAATNLHIENDYSDYAYVINFIVIIWKYSYRQNLY